MKTFTATTEINATPETVWQVLTNAEDYPNWNPTVTKIEGTIAADEKIKVYAQISGDRAFDVTVEEFDAPSKMVWKGGIPLMLKGIRTFLIEEKSDGVVEFSMNEEFSGMMVGAIPDLSDSFNDFAEALKKKCEE